MADFLLYPDPEDVPKAKTAEPPPSFSQRMEAINYAKKAQATTANIIHGAADIAIPAVGGAIGAGATALALPEAGPGALAVGAGAGSAAGRGLYNTLNWAVDKGYLPGRVTPPQSVLEEENTSPWWQTPLEYATEFGYGALGEVLMPAVRGIAASSRYAPRMAGKGLPAAGEYAATHPYSRTPKIDTNISGMTKVDGKWTMKMPEGDRLAAQLGDRMPEPGDDFLGITRDLDPSTLPKQQYELYKVNRAAARAEARKGYATLDKVLNHKNNVAPRDTIQVGETISGKEKLPRLNNYDIHVPFDYGKVESAVDEFTDIIYKQIQAGRMGDNDKVARIANRLLNAKADKVVSWQTAYNDLATLKRLAADPEYGTKQLWQRSMIDLIEAMQPIVDDTLKQAARNARVPIKQVMASLEAGNTAWRSYKINFGSPAALGQARTGGRAETSVLLGTSDKQAPRIAGLQTQFGPDAMKNWAGAHWKNAINKSMIPSETGAKLNVEAFDKALNAPGPTTTSYLFPTGGSYAAAVGDEAVQASRRALFDNLLDGNYNKWLSLSERTKDFVAGGSSILRNDLDSFFQAMQTLSPGKALDKGPAAGVIRETLQAITDLGYESTRIMIPPGAAGRVQRHLLKKAADILTVGDVSSLGYLTRALRKVALVSVTNPVSKSLSRQIGIQQFLPRTAEPPPIKTNTPRKPEENNEIQLIF